MKYLYSSIVLLVLAFRSAVLYADNTTTYLPDIEIEGQEVVRQNRAIELKMVFDLSRLHIRTQHTVALTPVLVSSDGSREAAFPPVVIDGKTRSKVYLRAQHLNSLELPPYHDDHAQVIIRRKNGKEQRYDYQAVMPYERWMLDGRMELREQVSGCVNCDKGRSVQPIPEGEQALAAFVPRYQVEQIQPKPEVVKRRAEVRVARLQFRQDSYVIEPNFKNNRAELDTVTSSIEVVKTDPDLSITGITITGYASPEGSMAYNKRLSQQRADALAKYAQKDTRIDPALWQVNGVGEDWDGLRKEVEKHPNLLKIDEVLRIIDECQGDQDACEQRIKALVPPTIYERLLNEMYGPLRRNEYRIEYNVRNFNLDEAKQQIKTRPELLSVEEIYRVAEAFGKGTDSYREAIRTAARTYPANVAAVVNAARVEMELEDYPAAIRWLESSSVKEAPEVLNALGVAYSKWGQYEEAQKILEQAHHAGSAEAEVNRQQVQGLMNDL